MEVQRPAAAAKRTSETNVERVSDSNHFFILQDLIMNKKQNHLKKKKKKKEFDNSKRVFIDGAWKLLNDEIKNYFDNVNKKWRD